MVPDPTDVVQQRYLSLKEAADWYGVSERTLRRRVSEGRLRAYRVGPRSIRVRSTDVAALAEQIPTTQVGE